jgi:hypothetical protein
LGLGDLTAVEILYETAERLGGRIHQQHGLRVGVARFPENARVREGTAGKKKVEALFAELKNLIGLRHPQNG